MMECTCEKKQLQIEQSCKSRHTFSMCKAWGKDISKELSCYIPKYLINYKISHRLSSHLDLIPSLHLGRPCSDLEFLNPQSTALECEVFCL